MGSSPIVVAFEMQPFSTSMMMGEGIFGFLETVCSIRKGSCTLEYHTLKSKCSTTQSWRTRSSSGCNFKRLIHVPSLPTPRISQFQFHRMNCPKSSLRSVTHSGFDQPLNRKKCWAFLCAFPKNCLQVWTFRNTLMLLNMWNLQISTHVLATTRPPLLVWNSEIEPGRVPSSHRPPDRREGSGFVSHHYGPKEHLHR